MSHRPQGHGGKLWAENGSSLSGARFSFTLPVAPQAAE